MEAPADYRPQFSAHSRGLLLACAENIDVVIARAERVQPVGDLAIWRGPQLVAALVDRGHSRVLLQVGEEGAGEP